MKKFISGIKEKNKNQKQKVFLVINTGYFGDTILTSKLTMDIKKFYPNSVVLFIVDKPYFEVAKGLPGVDKVVCYDRSNQGFLASLKFILTFPHKFNIDVAFIAQRKKKSRDALAWALGAKKIFSLHNYQHSEFFAKSQVKSSIHKRFACQLANLLSYLTLIETDSSDVEYKVPEVAQQKIDNYLGSLGLNDGIVAINPQASSDWKCWNIAETVKFAKMLINAGKNVVLTGVLKDGPEYVEAFNAELGAENFLNMVSQTSVAELGALYERCEAVISVDTGSMHMACAVGTPTITLFFRDYQEIWAPLNEVKNPYIYAPEGVSAEQVYDRLQRLINLPDIQTVEKV